MTPAGDHSSVPRWQRALLPGALLEQGRRSVRDWVVDLVMFGLAIGFSIARAHGGSLELLETSEDGSCFRVELPIIKQKASRE